MGGKCQAHNLKVVGSNPTPATNLFNKINNLHAPLELRFLGVFRFKPDKDHRVISKGISSHPLNLPF